MNTLTDMISRIVVSILLILLIVALPALEIQSVISAAGYEYSGNNKGYLRLAWVFQILATTMWLLGFWWSGAKMLGRQSQTIQAEQSLNERTHSLSASFMFPHTSCDNMCLQLNEYPNSES